jgi:hypothetical protein
MHCPFVALIFDLLRVNYALRFESLGTTRGGGGRS